MGLVREGIRLTKAVLSLLQGGIGALAGTTRDVFDDVLP